MTCKTKEMQSRSSQKHFEMYAVSHQKPLSLKSYGVRFRKYDFSAQY
jgi:hypothetical protein